MSQIVKSIFFAITILMLSGCLDLDGFLFKPEEKEKYDFPNNTIADSLISEVEFASGNETLAGVWVKSNGDRAGITVLYCHGNKWNIDNYWDRVMMFHKMGINVFVFDYRGFGKSTGKSSEEGLHEDAISAYNYIRNTYSVNSDSLMIYGYSLGNVASIFLASQDTIHPLLLVAEAPFASANSLTQSSTLFDIPDGWLTSGHFDNAENIQKINTPYFHFHGEDDDLVRWIDNGRVVYNLAPNPKKLVLVPKANHTTIPQTMGVDVYLDSLTSFVNQVIDDGKE